MRAGPDSPLGRYDRLRAERPELFAAGGPGSIEIVDAGTESEAESSGDPGTGNFGIVYQDRYILLLRDRVRFPGGAPGAYLRVIPADSSPGVAVLPVEAGRIVLVHHFRHATRQWHWEIPRGFGDPGDRSAEDSARRELQEEIGAVAQSLHDLGRIHPDTGMSSSVVALFLAEVASVGALEATEGISDVRRVSVQEFRSMIRAGDVTDAFSLVAFGNALAHGLLSVPAE